MLLFSRSILIVASVLVISILPEICESYSVTDWESKTPSPCSNPAHRLGEELQRLENSFDKLASYRAALEEKENIIDGKDGTGGAEGTDGKDRKYGTDNKNGKDDTDVQEGKDSTDGNDGKNGEKGKDENNGKDGNSWAKLEISPNSIATVLYNDFLVNIYEHSGNQRLTKMDQNTTLRKYYYAPLALLDVSSARCFKNELVDQFEMEFKIDLWNENIQKQVTTFIKREFDPNVMDNSIQIIPFKELILTSSSSIFKKKYKFSVDTWLTYQQRKSIPFSLFVESNSHCQKIKENMQEEPQAFRSLRLQFRVDSETSQTKETIINIQSIMSGDLMTKLNQQLPTAQFALLREGDTQQMLSESTSNILFDQFDDSEIVSPNADNDILPAIKSTLLEATNVLINQMNSTLWGNVFMNDDNYRPDKLTKSFNSIYDKLDTASKKNLKDIMTSNDTLKFETAVDVPEYISVKADADIEHGREKSTAKESVEKFMKESKEKVQWDGVKFVPKPMACSRVNLAKLRDSKTLVDRSVNVQYSTSTLSVQVNMPPRLGLLPANPLIRMEKDIEELSTNINFQVNRVNNLKPKMVQQQANVGKQIQTFEFQLGAVDKRINFLDNGIAKELIPKHFVIFDAYLMAPQYRIGVISYDGLKTNVVPDPLFIRNGVFTVPISGIYEFTFHGISSSAGPEEIASVNLMVNNRTTSVQTSSYLLESKVQLAMSTIILLNENDEVACQLKLGHLVNVEDYHSPNAHFTGQLLYSTQRNAKFL